MDWDDIFSILLPILVAGGWLWAFLRRKKGGQNKAEELCQHLLGIGVKGIIPEDINDDEPNQKELVLVFSSVYPST